jgi:NitT/TauT family transport system ATP-binding protein
VASGLERSRASPIASPGAPVRFAGLSKSYRTASGDLIHALDNISLSVASGEFVSIVGPSGCGKSTLLKILAGLTSPTAGTATIAGSSAAAVQSEIGFVFQEATLLPWLTVLRNVLVPADVARIPRTQMQARAMALLDLVGLKGFHDKYPNELSGGMQQRAAICRALLRDPKILLMDEPFGALDALTRDRMNIELLRIWEAQRNTILFVTHSITEAVLLSDRIVVMSPRPGRLLEDVPVSLPRPRNIAMVNTPEFGAYAQHIRDLLDASSAPQDEPGAVQ